MSSTSASVALVQQLMWGRIAVYTLDMITLCSSVAFFVELLAGKALLYRRVLDRVDCMRGHVLCTGCYFPIIRLLLFTGVCAHPSHPRP